MILSGKKGSRDWSDAEIEELIETGRVSGYHGHHVYNVADHPLFARIPENIRFLTPKEHLDIHGGNWKNTTFGDLILREQ